MNSLALRETGLGGHNFAYRAPVSAAVVAPLGPLRKQGHHTAPYWGQGQPVGQLCQGWDGKISRLGNPSLLKVVYKGWGGEDKATSPSVPGRESWEQRRGSWGLCLEMPIGL